MAQHTSPVLPTEQLREPRQQDRATLAPAAAQAAYVANRMRERGVLLGTDGPFHNVLKIKPPLIFDAANADELVETLDAVLGEDGAQAGR